FVQAEDGIRDFHVTGVQTCALPILPTMLAFRVLQGLSAGVGLIVGRAVIRDCLQGDDAQRLMSHVSMIFGVAPAIAPIIGGWILDRKSVVEAESVRLSGGRLRGLYR